MLRSYFFEDDTTWCVRRAKRIPLWKRIYHILSADVVLMIIIAYVASVLLLYSFASFEDRPCDMWTSIHTMYQILMLVPFNFMPKRSILRLGLGWSMLVMIAATGTYLAFAVDYMMRPRLEKQIDTFDQLINNNFRLAGDKFTRNYLEERNLVKHKLFKFYRKHSHLFLIHLSSSS